MNTGNPSQASGSQASGSSSPSVAVGGPALSDAPPKTSDSSPRASPSLLDAAVLHSILTRFQCALDVHRDRINSLNVYPVPDGDTGTNMSLTIRSVTERIKDTGDADGAEHNIETLCKAMSHGALMGARGNSGVIMAQILRGIATVLRDASAAGEPLNADVLARALSAASEGAYDAVGNPVEGTILTVLREASEAASAAVDAGADLLGVFDAARARGYDALDRTPQMLKVLADAGVVDAGGTGLVLFFDAGRAELGGHEMPIPEASAAPVGSVQSTAASKAAESQTATPTMAVPSGESAGESGEPSIADLRYEVMFLLDADDSDVGGFKDVWAEIGDSIAVIGGDGMWNCHIHTDDIGAAIEAGIAVGRPHRIQVTDLLEQVAEQESADHCLEGSHDSHDPGGSFGGDEIGRSEGTSGTPRNSGSSVSSPQASLQEQEARPGDALPVSADSSPPSSLSGDASALEPVDITEPDGCSVVAVGAGEGVKAIFASLGASRVVSGGQSMNPSTADLLTAVDSLPTGHVVVLPNNSNIIPVAEQLNRLTERRVSVLPTSSVVQGITAMMAFAPDADSDCNSREMAEAADEVVVGEVAQAVRDAVSPAGPVSVGDWIGVGPEGIAVVEGDEVSAATGLLATLITDDYELLTIITGAEAGEAAIAAVVGHVQETYPDLEVETRYGGQPLYPYYFGLE